MANIVNNCLCYVQWNWILPFSLAESTSLIWSGVAVSLHFSLGGNSTGWGAILQVLPGIYSVWLLKSILSGQGGKGLQSESTNKKDLNTNTVFPPIVSSLEYDVTRYSTNVSDNQRSNTSLTNQNKTSKFSYNELDRRFTFIAANLMEYCRTHPILTTQVTPKLQRSMSILSG